MVIKENDQWEWMLVLKYSQPDLNDKTFLKLLLIASWSSGGISISTFCVIPKQDKTFPNANVKINSYYLQSHHGQKD